MNIHAVHPVFLLLVFANKRLGFQSIAIFGNSLGITRSFPETPSFVNVEHPSIYSMSRSTNDEEVGPPRLETMSQCLAEAKFGRRCGKSAMHASTRLDECSMASDVLKLVDDIQLV